MDPAIQSLPKGPDFNSLLNRARAQAGTRTTHKKRFFISAGPVIPPCNPFTNGCDSVAANGNDARLVPLAGDNQRSRI